MSQQHQQSSSSPVASIALTAVHPGAQGISLPKIGTLIPNRIFVGGINSNTTEDELRGFFSVFGPIRDVKVIYDKSGLSKGSYGFVTFEDQETAESIIKNEAETLIFKDRKLNVGYAVRKQHILPKQELGSTLLLAHNTCPITNGLQLVQLCPHDHSFLTMNQSAMYYPATFMVSPTVGSHEFCALLTGAMNTPTQAIPAVKPGSGPLPVKGLICAHTIPVHPTATLGCPLSTGSTRPVQSACWHPESVIIPEKPKTATMGADLNHPRLISNACSELNNDFSFTQNKPTNVVQQTPFIRSTVSTGSTGSWIESHNRSLIQQEQTRSTINSVGLSAPQYNSTDPISHVLYIPAKEYRTCPQSTNQPDSNVNTIQVSRSFPGNLTTIGCSSNTATNACATTNHTTVPIDQQQTTRVTSTNGTVGAARRVLQPGVVFNPASRLTDPSSFGSGIPLTGNNVVPRSTQSVENKFESIFSNNKERQGLWSNGLQPPSRREDQVLIKQVPSHSGLEVTAQNVMNMSHNSFKQFSRQSRWPTLQTECFDETVTDSRFPNSSDGSSRGLLRQLVQTPNKLEVVNDQSSRLCTMEETTGRDNTLGLSDDHEQCIRQLLIEKLLERAGPLEVSNITVPGEQQSSPTCFLQTNRLVDIIRDEGRNEAALSDSSSHLPGLEGFNCSESFPTVLMRKDNLNETLSKRVYDDDIQNTTKSNQFIDPGATVNSVTISGLSPKKYNSEDIVDQETNSTSSHMTQSAEIRTLSVQKLESSAMNPNALATTACGDISKQRPV